MKRKILLTGAAGRIGSFLTNQWQAEYDLYLTDIRKPDETFGFPFTEVNLADYDALATLCVGMDTVVHMGADPSMEASWESLLPNNVIGTYNAFEAAHQAKCRRVIYASSINAVLGYPADTQVQVDMPVYPINLYGATKCWGEALGRYYAHTHNLSSICLRFGAVSQRPGGEQDDRYDIEHEFLDMVITLDDLTQLVTKSVEAPDDIDFAVYQGVSNNRWKRLDIRNAREQIGYAPEDDAIEIALRKMNSTA
ncbi:MAG: NAD(P)-dependent oxidoreductase [Chloroflexota bacterium]